MSRKSLKLRYDLPFRLEMILINKYGYRIDKKIYGQYLIFSKSDEPAPNVLALPDYSQKVSDYRKKELERICDSIVSFFHDPYSVPLAVRTRLHNRAQTLEKLPERQFILEYMDDNFPLEGNQ
jgi:hypothetical protein